MALTTAQYAALTTSQLAVLPAGSPILLDLDRDGIRTTTPLAGTLFDVYADGQPVHTGWVGQGDGLLALDRNHDGKINDGGELFGNSSPLANGSKAADGYAALREFDLNQDGVIDAKDAVYQDLRVWVDGNGDGVSQAQELQSLSQWQIASVSTQASQSNTFNSGNWVGLTSHYTSSDGSQHCHCRCLVCDARRWHRFN